MKNYVKQNAIMVHVENLASRRVMEKIGMTHIDDRVQYSCLQAYYEIYRGSKSLKGN